MTSSPSSVLRPRVFGSRLSVGPFRPERAADAEGRQQAPVRQKIDRRALPRHQHRVAHRQRQHVDAELDPPGAPGERRQRAHAFEKRRRADQPVGLPDRVDPARLAQIDPAPIGVGAGKRKLHQPDPDRDVSRHRILLAYRLAPSGRTMARSRHYGKERQHARVRDGAAERSAPCPGRGAGGSRPRGMTASSRWRTSTIRFSRWPSPAWPRAGRTAYRGRDQFRAHADGDGGGRLGPRRLDRRAVRDRARLAGAGRITSGAFRCRGPRRRRACANTSRYCARSGAAGRPARNPPTRASTTDSR